MNEGNKDIRALISKHMDGSLTEAERKQLHTWVTASEQNSQAFQDLSDEYLYTESLTYFNDEILEAGKEKLSRELGIDITAGRKRLFSTAWVKYAAAAAAVIVVAAGIYIFQANNKTDIVGPGGNNATLQLADGSTIPLQQQKNGLIAGQGATKVHKQDSELVYQSPPGAVSQKTLYNSLTTERNGKFKIQLPDGSRVWLNTTSTVRYPVSGTVRRAILNGEAYFEIEKNPALPFVVTARNVEIQVTGTRFNVNTNKDDSIKTTLLEGTVTLVKGDKTWLLNQGQQATTSHTGPADEMEITNIQDSTEIVGWKNGEFYFNGANIRTLMGKISDWYNVRIVYHGNLNWVNYTGHFSSSLSIQDLFKQLERIDIHAELNERTITVSPKRF